MCPPPDNPIRPIGGISREEMVDRASAAARITRRRPRDEETPEQHEQRRRQDQRETLLQAWRARAGHSPAADTGAYDDHGRVERHDGHGDQPHVDAQV